MKSIEFLKERQKVIGGSDVGAIMGVNKYKSIFEVYSEKTAEDILKEIKKKALLEDLKSKKPK